MIKTTPCALYALAVAFCAGCSNPVLDPVDTFVNQTYCPAAEEAIAKDSTMAPEFKAALQTELKAMRRLLDVACNRETSTAPDTQVNL